MESINTMLLDLAHHQQKMSDRLPELQAQIDTAKQEIAALEKTEKAMQDTIKAYAMQYWQETGKTDLHDCITMTRRTKLCYDRDEALEWALEQEESGAVEADTYVKRTTALKVRPFEAMLKSETPEWANFETTPAPTISIGKLGHLLFFEETE